MHTLPRSHRQEALSRAYVRAIAAEAGVTCGDVVADYGIDLLLRGVEEVDGEYRDTGPQIDLQLKSTTRSETRSGELVYDLDVRSYNLLRRVTVYRPCYLVLLVLPEDDALWISQSVEELILRQCAYGVSLCGAGETANVQSIRITIPRGNVFSTELLRRWMAEAKRGNGT